MFVFVFVRGLEKDGTFKTTFKGHTADVHCLAPDRDLLFRCVREKLTIVVVVVAA
jgi:hypothetical protein